jgi:hypothetical protein
MAAKHIILWMLIGVLMPPVGACGGDVHVAPSDASGGETAGTTGSGTGTIPQTCIDVCSAFDGCWTAGAEACIQACAKRSFTCAVLHDAYLRCALDLGKPASCGPTRGCNMSEFLECEGGGGALKSAPCQVNGQDCCSWLETSKGQLIVSECGALGDECTCLLDEQVFARCDNRKFGCDGSSTCCTEMAAIHGLNPPE